MMAGLGARMHTLFTFIRLVSKTESYLEEKRVGLGVILKTPGIEDACTCFAYKD